MKGDSLPTRSVCSPMGCQNGRAAARLARNTIAINLMRLGLLGTNLSNVILWSYIIAVDSGRYADVDPVFIPLRRSAGIVT